MISISSAADCFKVGKGKVKIFSEMPEKRGYTNVTNIYLYKQIWNDINMLQSILYGMFALNNYPFPHTTNLQQMTLKASRQKYYKISLNERIHFFLKSGKNCDKRRHCSS